MKQKLLDYLKSDRHYWWTASVLPGLYLILYTYRHNFFQVNSVEQLSGLALLFIAIPSIILLVLDYFFKKNDWDRKKLYFLVFAIISSIAISFIRYRGFHLKALIALGIATMIGVFFLSRFYKAFTLLLAAMFLIGLVSWTPYFIEVFDYKYDWIHDQKWNQQTFKKKPNIYIIQPDGYPGRETLRESYYSFDNKEFYNHLENEGFIFNNEYRSNYSSTLSSNAALFTASHHYHNYNLTHNELPYAREIISGSNQVLKTFKNNDYLTSFFSSSNYLRLNYVESGYNLNNIQSKDLDFFPKFRADLNYMEDFKAYLSQTKSDQPNFSFIEILKPGHITPGKKQTLGKIEEREEYLKNLEEVNPKLEELITLIKKHDENALIVLVADHGGYVGLEYTGQVYESVIKDPVLRNSMFSALFAVHAPSDFEPYRRQIKSSVSLFPNLIAYLNDEAPVTDSDDSSYIFIKENGERQVYRYFDSGGNHVTEKVN
ncbi:hypothetical protein BST97_13865 [Nonlabens spongiae]|uniref:Sulfatase N-terminal domain-containing protein n=1 Tax=Nonlabens spongiae TaxID=331648 RepID=A0A1W6MN33_9FLAO|nr:hypothetical protein [Nonlabens spongiae]ARN78987.1 hypothetical protein BST97_13865 [Nonlabens spongiae]